jgi:hypothetical protein
MRPIVGCLLSTIGTRVPLDGSFAWSFPLWVKANIEQDGWAVNKSIGDGITLATVVAG